LRVEGGLKRKIANLLRQCAEPIRVMRLAFIFSFATSQGGVKGTNFSSSIRCGVLAVFAPGGAVLDDPVRQRLLETDVASGLLRLDPLVPENFLALRLKLAVERRILQQIVRR
jgi:hypothetical protein